MLTVGDVWFAHVPFNDVAPGQSTPKSTGKPRPVVILGWSSDPDSVVLVVPITSFGSSNFTGPQNGDIEVSDLSIAGLTKQSWIRARRVHGAHPKSLDSKRGALGRVTSRDLNAVYAVIAALLPS